MKVLPVSFGTRKINNNTNNSYNAAFLYTPETDEKFQGADGKKLKLLLGTAAILAVGMTLFKLKGRKKFSENIVEITDKNKGLNKLTDLDRTVDELKTKIIYPLKAKILGDKNIEKSIKSGLIIADKDSDKLDEILQALTEHFKELGINTITIPKVIHKTAQNGEIMEKKIKKNALNKLLYSVIKGAEKTYKEKGTYTVVNLGNLNDFTDLRVIKSQKSNFEELLENLNGVKYPGVLWVSWTSRTNSLPLFLSDLPVLITKILD